LEQPVPKDCHPEDSMTQPRATEETPRPDADWPDALAALRDAITRNDHYVDRFAEHVAGRIQAIGYAPAIAEFHAFLQVQPSDVAIALAAAAAALPPPAAVAVPNLASYDILLANISGGKDSQTVLRLLVREADKAGVRDRIVVVFADLGAEDEWPGTAELAAAHAAHYGLRFITVCRRVDDGHGGKRQQGLLEYMEHRGLWPDKQNRFCTVI
jgi:hypothetical protein